MSVQRFTFTRDEVHELLLQEVRKCLQHAVKDALINFCSTTVWGQMVNTGSDFDTVVIEVPNKE